MGMSAQMSTSLQFHTLWASYTTDRVPKIYTQVKVKRFPTPEIYTHWTALQLLVHVPEIIASQGKALRPNLQSILLSLLIALQRDIRVVKKLVCWHPWGEECRKNVHKLWKLRIHRSWAVFVVDDIIVYFLSLFTFRYHFLPLYYHFSTCCTCYLRYTHLI